MKAVAAGVFWLVFAGIAVAQTADRPVGVGTMQQGTFAYALAAAVAKVVSEAGDIRAIIQPYGGTSTFVPLIDRGELDLGVVNAMETVLAKTGRDTFEGKPNPAIRAVAALAPSYVSILVKKDSGIGAPADLKGKRVPWGFPAQTIVQYMTVGLIANAGLREDDVQKVQTATSNRQFDDLVSGRIDATFTALGTPRVQEVDVQVGGVRYLSLYDAPDRAAAMTTAVPGTHVIKLEPGPGRFGVIEPTNFMGYKFMLLAGARTSDEAVYKTVAALYANKDALAAAHPSLRAFEPSKMVEMLPGIEYHPGAIKFYREKDIWPGR